MTRFKDWQYPEIIEGQDTKWGWRVSNVHKFIMGERVDIGYGSYFQAEAGISIGSDVQIGGGVKIYSVDTIGDKRGPVVIKKDAKIGALSVIMPGVTIGEKAIVGAHSFVNRDIPDGETWFGVPAKRYEKWRGYVVQGEESHSCRGMWVDRPGNSVTVPSIGCGCQGAGPEPSG